MSELPQNPESDSAAQAAPLVPALAPAPVPDAPPAEAPAPQGGAVNPVGALADKLDSKPYSGIPLENRRNWVVPKWLKEAFVAFALLCVLAVAGSKANQHWGGALERAKAAVDGDDLDGSFAPPFKLPLRGGGELTSDQLKGKLILVNFWASWCAPCREEEPSLDQLAKAYDPSSLQVVAISVDDAWDPIEKFFAGRKPAYSVLWDEGGKTSLRFGTSKFPESYILDASGKQRVKFIGPRNWMEPAMFALLAEMGAKRAGMPKSN
jgi:thiol-disulfide isomerase/thioredoxin